jgi:hydrogenase-4 membrane subunit HyfE
LQPEPFLVVGMIAVTRRILVLTAEMSKLAKETKEGFYNAMIELGLLTILIISIVVCLRMLKPKDQSGGNEA